MITNDPKLERQYELSRQSNNKAFARIASENWRKHVPVYGWMQINYPSTIGMPLLEKYKMEKELKSNKLKELTAEVENNIEKQEKHSEEGKNLPEISDKNQTKSEQKESEKENEKNEEKKLPEIRIRGKKNKYRVSPEIVNQKEMDEAARLVKHDFSENFLKNYPNNDMRFLKEQFKKFDNVKKGYNLANTIPQNNVTLKAEGDIDYLYQLGIKKSVTYLTTMPYEKQCEFIDMNCLIDQKYCTMFPKSAILGPKQDADFTNKNKNRGDLSFEEDKDDVENVKNLARLPPDNITEEWVKENLTAKVTKINLSNCYWLTKDLLSKLGRLDKNLLSVNLRCLDISNYIVENILVYAKNCKELNLANCTGLTNGLMEIFATKGKCLESLNLLGLTEAVNDQGLLNIGESLLNLQKIILSNNSQITDKGIKGLVVNQPKLSYVDISYCFKITNDGFTFLLSNLHQTLQKLFINCLPLLSNESLENLSKCKQLTELEMIGVAPKLNACDFIKSLTELRVLDVSGSSGVKDEDLIALLIQNKNLRILRCSNCTEITNNILEFFTKDNVGLLLFEINRTPKITDAKIAEVQERMMPNLRLIRTTNIVWSKKNLGLTVQHQSDLYQKKAIKGVKKAAAKKNDDKSPEVQLMKLREEMKPKRIFEYFIKEKAGKKGGKKKK